MDKCIIRCSDKPFGNTLVRVYPATYRKLDALANCMGQLGASTPEAAEPCRAAANIIFALSEEGAKTPDDALDILHDYRLQAKQYSALHRKHQVAGKPIFKDGVWHCPDCNGRTSPNHSYCHRCGKKLGWR